nr:MFS transporter [Providencia stuartii]
MATLDISIVNVALPAIQRDLNADMGMLQWIIDAYALCLSALILSVGPISDRYGRKKVWLAGIAIFTLGSALCPLRDSDDNKYADLGKSDPRHCGSSTDPRSFIYYYPSIFE